MADLMRQMTVERGRDPRDFVVYAFGGAGGAHAVEFARELGCKEVVVPLGDFASTWSALGVMSSDVLHVHEHSELATAPFAADQLNSIYSKLEEEARAQLREEGFGDDRIELVRFADMKFPMQIHQVEVPVPGGVIGEAEAAAQVDHFIARYEQTYGEGSAFPDAGTQIGVYRVLARGRLRTPELPEIEPRDAVETVHREVYWRDLGGFHATEVVPAEALGAGFEFEGPTILDLPDTTVVVPPGATGRVDPLGSIVIDAGAPLVESPAVQAAAANR
jgi:N-methylhydantoinase A